MGDLYIFTIITGVATLVGLTIQLFDIFPRFIRFRSELLLFIVGLFFGSLIASLSGSRLTLTVPLTPMQLLIGSVAIITAFLVLSARFQEDTDRRQETYLISFGGVCLMVLLTFIYGLATSNPATTTFTLDEYVALADRASSRGDLERAIDLLERAQNSLPRKDQRYLRLEARIDVLQTSQISETVPARSGEATYSEGSIQN